jgi:hypothetical protein
MTDVVAIETAAVDENASPSLPASKPGTRGTLSGLLIVLSYVIVPVAFILVWDLAVRYNAVPST